MIWFTLLVGSTDADSSNYDDMVAEVADLNAEVSDLTMTVRELVRIVADIQASKVKLA